MGRQGSWKRVTVLGLLLLAGCGKAGPKAEGEREMGAARTRAMSPLPASAAAQTKRNQTPTTSEWLVGYWVVEGQECESDAGVSYDAKGRWAAYSAAGTWQLQGDRLLTSITETYPDDDEAPAVKLAEPKRHTEALRAVSPNEFVSTWEDGTVRKLKRCPAQEVHLDSDDEIRFWTEQLGASREKIAEAIGKVGPTRTAVELYFGVSK